MSLIYLKKTFTPCQSLNIRRPVFSFARNYELRYNDCKGLFSKKKKKKKKKNPQKFFIKPLNTLILLQRQNNCEIKILKISGTNFTIISSTAIFPERRRNTCFVFRKKLLGFLFFVVFCLFRIYLFKVWVQRSTDEYCKFSSLFHSRWHIIVWLIEADCL